MFLHLGLMRSNPLRKGGACADTPGSVHTWFGPALEAVSASLQVIFTLQEGLGPAHTAQCTEPLLFSSAATTCNTGWGAGVS